MGCDIHIVIERRKNADEPWENVPYAVKPWHDEDLNEEWLSRTWAEHRRKLAAGAVEMPRCFDNRNYDLFGILGNVRNGYGFAGIVTGDPWPPLTDQRGVPSDSTAKPDRDGYYEDIGDHSFTYMSLEELRGYDWDGTVSKGRGVVKFDVWHKWVNDPNAEPSPFPRCGGLTGPRVEIISEVDAHRRTDNLHDSLYVETTWSETARHATNNWIGEVVPVLDAIAGCGDLRLVMGFDS
jgi:hypothetical protein